MAKDKHQQEQESYRLDKWLWAARFYKTRTLAREMVDGGKVHYNGQRTKPSKEVEIGAMIKLRQGNDEKEVQVLALSNQRKAAPLAQQLYQKRKRALKNGNSWRGQEKQMPYQCRIRNAVQTKKSVVIY